MSETLGLAHCYWKSQGGEPSLKTYMSAAAASIYYCAGLIDKIIFAGDDPHHAGLPMAALMQEIAVNEFGVPNKAIIVPERLILNTADEIDVAEQVRKSRHADMLVCIACRPHAQATVTHLLRERRLMGDWGLEDVARVRTIEEVLTSSLNPYPDMRNLAIAVDASALDFNHTIYELIKLGIVEVFDWHYKLLRAGTKNRQAIIHPQIDRRFPVDIY